MVSVLAWPSGRLTPSSISVMPKTQSRSGGKTLVGTEQVVQSPAFAWSIKLGTIFIRNEDQVLTWRALEAALDGRANQIMVPAFDWQRSPAGRSQPTTFASGATFAGGARFRSAATDVVLAADAALNATILAVTWNTTPPQAGQFFSFGQRLHRVAGVKAGPVPGSASLSIRPWLRDPWQVGTRLDFDEPACVCRLESDDAMSLDLDVWKYGMPSVSLVEAF